MDFVLTSKDFKKTHVLFDGSCQSYFGHRKIFLFTDNKMVKKKFRTKNKKLDKMDANAYAFRSTDEKGYNRLGIWVSPSIKEKQHFISLLAHEIHHIVDYILDDADEDKTCGLEIAAYISQDLMYNSLMTLKRSKS